MINSLTKIFACWITFITCCNAQPIDHACLNFREAENSFESILNDYPKINSNPVVLLGESHGINVNYDIFLGLIKFLNSQKKYRNVLVERSYAEAYLYNRYLETKNLELIRLDVNWCEEMKTFMERLGRYNSEQLPDSKIIFYGIDAVHSLDQVVLFFKEIIPSEVPPTKISDFIDSIKAITVPMKKKCCGKERLYQSITLMKEWPI